MILSKKAIISYILISVSVFLSLLLLFNMSKKVQVSSNNFSSVCIPTIIIDVGHGGEDGGAVANDGTLEKDLNLSISLYLKDMLKASGFDVIMIREDDVALSENENSIRERKISDMYNRLDIYDNSNKNIIVSIHQNNFSEEKYSGSQIFYGVKNENSSILANSIRNSIIGMLQPNNTRENKAATNDAFLLYNTQSTAVIVECGFMSNKDELELLKTQEYQKEMAFSIMCGILDYYNKMEC